MLFGHIFPLVVESIRTTVKSADTRAEEETTERLANHLFQHFSLLRRLRSMEIW